jgi:transcriptional regulator with XRE-family HTH domain
LVFVAGIGQGAMPRETLTGSRIRERRTMAGLKQADLARESGISASYLNLIEHNRRRIGGKLLLNIAAALGVEPQTLTDGAEAALIATLREAADREGLKGPELERADEFAGRFPAWADVLAGARRRMLALEQTIEMLTDRLSHDPHLAASMHELLSTAAAVRSTAAILAETKTLQPEWRERFHANINEDSRRLSDSAEALVAYLDAADATADAPGSPQEEVERFLESHDYSFASLEAAGPTEATVERLIAEARPALSQPAQFIARGALMQVAEDGRAVPLDRLKAALAVHGTEPLRIAQDLRQPVGLILRRLAALPELGAGLVVCDRSGTVIFRKSTEGFTVPRYSGCCPLWPIFAALGSPGQTLRETVTQEGRAQASFTAYAIAETVAPPSYNAPALTQAFMLLVPVPAAQTPGMEVGSSCRVCSLAACNARREPSIFEPRAES